MKYIVLRHVLSCATLGTPFPQGVELQFSVIGSAVVIHHPKDRRVTRVIRPEQVTRIAFRDQRKDSIVETIRLFALPGEVPEKFLQAQG